MVNDVASLGFDLTQVLGRTEEEAVALLTAHGKAVRVVSRNGKVAVITKDVKPSRVNLHVEDGVVSSYTLG